MINTRHKIQDTSSQISIVVPCYNEESVIEIFLQQITPILENLKQTYEIIFINDGSTDNTLNSMINAKKIYKNIRIINLSRNFGKESALTAGLENANGDAVIPIDVDLQDPPGLIVKFIQKWHEGYDVV